MMQQPTKGLCSASMIKAVPDARKLVTLFGICTWPPMWLKISWLRLSSSTLRVMDPRYPKPAANFFSDKLESRFNTLREEARYWSYLPTAKLTLSPLLARLVVPFSKAALYRLLMVGHLKRLSAWLDSPLTSSLTTHFKNGHSAWKGWVAITLLKPTWLLFTLWETVGITKENVFGSTADNVKLNDKLAELLQVHHFRCWAHRLSLPMTNLICPLNNTETIISALIAKCRALLPLLSRPPRLATIWNLLKSLMEMYIMISCLSQLASLTAITSQDVVRLISDVRARFWSNESMLQRLLRCKGDIISAASANPSLLANASLVMNGIKWKT